MGGGLGDDPPNVQTPPVLFAVGRFTAPMDVELEVQQFVQSTVSDTWNAGHGGMEASYVFAQLMLRRYAA